MKQTTQNQEVEKELTRIVRLFKKWRSKKQYRETIPTELSEKLVPLARHFTIGKIASALHLNYQWLKRKINAEQTETTNCNMITNNQFAEVNLGSPPGNTNCNLEFENSLGEKLKILFRHDSAPTYINFIKTFLARK